MASHKTAYYSVAVPLACGAIIGGGTDEQVEALRSFGMATGLAVQLQADLLNLVGDKESVAKDFRCDITEGKRTLMVVHALANPQVSDELRGILSAHTTDPELLARAVELMEQAGSIAHARELSLKLVCEAKEALAPVELAQPAKDLLFSMADFFIERIV